MGIIAVLLYSQGYMGTQFHIPFWVVLACQAAMAVGTLAGGWRIVKTMGSKITRLTPMQGCCAETGGSIMLFAATELGIPVSTTHTITGCIIGVGAAKRVSAVRWSVAKEIVTAWIITIPAAGLIAALCYFAAGLFGWNAPQKKKPRTTVRGFQVCRLVFSLEAIVDAAAHDAQLKIDVGGGAASDCVAVDAAEIGVEIFDLGGPVAGDRAFDAGARGPAGVGGLDAAEAVPRWLRCRRPQDRRSRRA